MERWLRETRLGPGPCNGKDARHTAGKAGQMHPTLPSAAVSDQRAVWPARFVPCSCVRAGGRRTASDGPGEAVGVGGGSGERRRHRRDAADVILVILVEVCRVCITRGRFALTDADPLAVGRAQSYSTS
eukprot:7383644-Prymnesium_polylepis.1